MFRSRRFFTRAARAQGQTILRRCLLVCALPVCLLTAGCRIVPSTSVAGDESLHRDARPRHSVNNALAGTTRSGFKTRVREGEAPAEPLLIGVSARREPRPPGSPTISRLLGGVQNVDSGDNDSRTRSLGTEASRSPRNEISTKQTLNIDHNQAANFGPPAPDDSNAWQAEIDRPPFGFREEVKEDLRDFLPSLREDGREMINWNNAAILGMALGAAIGIRQDLDGKVRENVARHPERWGETSRQLGKFGDFPLQIPILLGVYGLSVKRQDEELRQFSMSTISAYALTGISTLTIKAIANTDRPSDEWNGGQFGFPSWHTASSFSMAAVVDEYYGHKASLPAYALAGLIGWSRIDERDHDLSDVLFGAALGYVIGKSVARGHLDNDYRVRILPYVHPTDGSSGMMFEVPF